MSTSERNWQGMNWIRQDKRLAIYLRDGCACVYCGASLESGAQLTLDHLKPVSRGGTHDHPNLVTCCFRCNSSRGKRSVAVFTRAVAIYLNGNTTPEKILAHVRRCACRNLNRHRAEAQKLLERRGSIAAALADVDPTGTFTL